VELLVAVGILALAAFTAAKLIGTPKTKAP
jgi:hypothetical protein